MEKIKIRKCQGCQQKFDRKSLIKITLSEGKLCLNPSNKVLGRSVYVCPNPNCIKNFIKKKRIISSLKFKKFEEVLSIEEKLLKIVEKLSG